MLPDWFYAGIVERTLVLTIDPAYFQLTGGIERWLYRIVRKHAGRQPGGWRFDLPHLHVKSGSLAPFASFAFEIRRIVGRQRLPGYRLALERNGARLEVLHFRPIRSSISPPVLCAKPERKL